MDNANVGNEYACYGSFRIGSSLFDPLEVNIMVKINGEDKNIAGMTIAEYLADAGYDERRVAVELDGNIVPKPQYKETVLSDGDSVEVVSFVGGG